MRKVTFSPHLAEKAAAQASPDDDESEEKRMDPRLPLVGAAIFAAVVAAGGWNFNSGPAVPVADPSGAPLAAISAVTPTPTVASPTASTPTPSLGTTTASPSVPPPGRAREDSRSAPLGGTPGPRGRDD